MSLLFNILLAELFCGLFSDLNRTCSPITSSCSSVVGVLVKYLKAEQNNSVLHVTLSVVASGQVIRARVFGDGGATSAGVQ